MSNVCLCVCVCVWLTIRIPSPRLTSKVLLVCEARHRGSPVRLVHLPPVCVCVCGCVRVCMCVHIYVRACHRV